MSLKISEFTDQDISGSSDYIPFVRYDSGSSCFQSSNYRTLVSKITASYALTSSFSISGGDIDVIIDGQGICSTLRTGSGNSSIGDYSAVLAGQGNTSDGMNSSVLGGRDNRADGCYSTLGGGWNNNVVGCFSTVSGGYQNTGSSDFSTISGGYCNRICAGANLSALGGGYNNVINGQYSTIAGGRQNVISNQDGTIGGGKSNTVSNFYGTIGGGTGNTVSNRYSVIAGGCNNNTDGQLNFIGGGFNNLILTSSLSVIGTGCNNVIDADTGCYNGILGGFNNCILNSCNTFIIGSGITANAISDFTLFNNICVCGMACGSGFNAVTVNCGSNSIMMPGSGTNSTLRDCSGNEVTGDYSSTLSGRYNKACSNCATIAGGQYNCTCGTSLDAVIGGGLNNVISNGSGSGIFGGNNNLISGNTDAFIIGSNLTSNANCTTYMNNLVVAGNISASGAFTSSGVFGTASYASKAITASYATTSSYSVHSATASYFDISTYNTLYTKVLNSTQDSPSGVFCYPTDLRHTLPSAGTYIIDGIIYYYQYAAGGDGTFTFYPSANITSGNFYLGGYKTDDGNSAYHAGAGVTTQVKDSLFFDTAGVQIKFAVNTTDVSSVLRATVRVSAPTTMCFGFRGDASNCLTLCCNSYIGFQKIA